MILPGISGSFILVLLGKYFYIMEAVKTFNIPVMLVFICGAAIGITTEETIAFGDADNDLEMLQLAGIGVAMGNALPQVRACADMVTDTVENDGIAHALQKLKLIG